MDRRAARSGPEAVEWAEYHDQLPELSAAEARELKKSTVSWCENFILISTKSPFGIFNIFWNRVLTAYRNGDPEELQTLRSCSEQEELLPEPSTMEQLAADIEKLAQKIKKMLRTWPKCRSSFI